MSSGRDNAFDLLRLLLAIGVVITHSYLIGGYGEQEPFETLVKEQTNLGEIGVMGFFALSGYLITASYERSSNLIVFILHRLFRLLPGFWVCLVVTAFVFAPLIFISSDRSILEFPVMGQGGAISYLWNNYWLQIKQWNIRSVLDHAAYSGSLNGSLWSLFPEIQCYMFTLVSGYLGLFKQNRFLLVFTAFYFCILFAVNSTVLPKYGPTFLVLGESPLKLYTSYIVGTCLYVFKDVIKLDKSGILFLLIITLLLLKFGGYKPVSPILIPLIAINLFGIFKFSLNFDLSYGVYIYSFPLQQLLYHYFEKQLSITSFILISLIGSCLCGLLSYTLVEKPFVILRKRVDAIFEGKLTKKLL